MDALHFTVATLPLGVYLLLIGLINLSGRPFVTTGTRDAATLGIGLAGLIIIGPMELFFPEGASRMLGAYVWLLLIAFYGLCVALFVLLMRPRIVIYNSSADRVRSVLSDIVWDLDKSAKRLEDGWTLPSINVRLNMEGGILSSNVQLVAVGARQNLEGWRLLEKKLRPALKSNRTPTNLIGICLVGLSLLLTATAAIWIYAQRTEVTQAVVDMLRLNL